MENNEEKHFEFKMLRKTVQIIGFVCSKAIPWHSSIDRHRNGSKTCGYLYYMPELAAEQYKPIYALHSIYSSTNTGKVHKNIKRGKKGRFC